MGISLENWHFLKADGGATELNKLRDKFGQTAWVRIERNRRGESAERSECNVFSLGLAFNSSVFA